MVTRTFNKWLLKTLCRIAERYIMERGDEDEIYLTMCIIKQRDNEGICVHFNNDPRCKEYISEGISIPDPRNKSYEVTEKGKEANNV